MDILKYCAELDDIMSESPKKKKLLKESIVKRHAKNSQKNRRINENYGNDGYMYLTKHGLGPGTLPKDVHLLKSKELPHYMTAIWLDRFLTTDELKKLDIYPETEIRRVMDFYDISERDLLGESCNTKRKNRKSLKEESNTHIDKVIVELDDEDEDCAYEVDGHILEDKYGFYQGIIILDDDKSQESIKKLGIKPGDKFIIGIRESTPEEEKYYGSNVMVDILSKLKEDSNKYIDKIIVELDDEDGDCAYEVRGNKLNNKYGFYQGVIILEDDESQERLKKLGIKPGDEFVVGIRKPTPEEQEMYDDAMDDTFYMADILYRYNESLRRENKRYLKEELVDFSMWPDEIIGETILFNKDVLTAEGNTIPKGSKCKVIDFKENRNGHNNVFVVKFEGNKNPVKFTFAGHIADNDIYVIKSNSTNESLKRNKRPLKEAKDRWVQTPYGFKELNYKGITITDYKDCEIMFMPYRYTVDYYGDEAGFDSLDDAKKDIDEFLNEYENN